jgi:pilus assembly protein Flp/PilA
MTTPTHDAVRKPDPLDEEGQGLAEYALILALIAIVAIVSLIFLGAQISHILSDVGTKL